MRIGGLFISIVSLPLILSSCGGCPVSNGTGESIQLEQVKIQESSPAVTVPGLLIPYEKSEIKMQGSGKIQEVFANKGDLVQKGAVLARLSEEEINQKLNQLRSQLKEAQAQSERYSYLYKNRDKLLEENKMDRTQYQGIEIELNASDATANRLKTDVAALEYDLAHLDVTAPISGIVSEKYISPLQNATEGQTLFLIVNTNPINVSFSLTSDESAGIKMGMPVNVRIDDLDGEEFQGQVSYISPDLLSEGRSFEVWASIQNPEGVLKGGMLASAEFTSLNTHKVFVVPKSSIISRNRDRFVFTVVNGIAHQTRVNIRTIHDDIAEVSNGLAENDLIVVKGAQNLQDGTQVQMR